MAFRKPLSNTARLLVHKSYCFPNVEDTKCPKLDRVIKQNMTKKVKNADSNAATLQTLNLDAVPPMIFILENTQPRWRRRGRKKITKYLNKDLVSLAEHPEMFEEADPLLFEAFFETKMKDHLETLKWKWLPVFSRGLPPVSTSGWRQQLQRKRRTEVPPLLPPKK